MEWQGFIIAFSAFILVGWIEYLNYHRQKGLEKRLLNFIDILNQRVMMPDYEKYILGQGLLDSTKTGTAHIGLKDVNEEIADREQLPKVPPFINK